MAPQNTLDVTNPIVTPQELIPDYAIEFENVSRRYRLHHEPKLTLQDRVINIFKKDSTYEEFWALKDVNFKLEKGKTLGVIGQNGAGKSTLLKLATRILEPTSGVIRVNGRVSAMLELGTGFHPELSARDNIYLNGAFYGFNRKEMDERYEQIVEFSELGKFIDTPVKHFSSGMYMRLGFAVAITVSPDILIIDEVLAVGDAAFGRKCHQAIEDLKSQSKAMLFVSHSAGEISRFCDEVIYLSKGKLVARGNPGEVLDEYMMDSMGPAYFTMKASSKSNQDNTTLPSFNSAHPPTSASSEKAANSHQSESVNKLDQVISAELSRYFRTSYGINAPHDNWEFSLPEEKANNNQAAFKIIGTDYYLAVINPLPEKQTLELIGYRELDGKLDRLAGALGQISLGSYEVLPYRRLLLPLKDKALHNISQIKLKAEQLVAAELIPYNPIPTHLNSATITGSVPALWWIVPFCDIRGDNQCRLEIFNPNDEEIDVALTLYRDWDVALFNIRNYRCSRHSHLILDLKEELAGGEGERHPGELFYGGVVVRSDQRIVVKRHNLQLSAPDNLSTLAE